MFKPGQLTISRYNRYATSHMILQFPRSSCVMCNFSTFHANYTVCNVNFSQIIQITNSYSLLPLPHFNQKRSAPGRQSRVLRMLSQKFSKIYLCRNFKQLLETASNYNCPKPVFSFLIPFCVRSAFFLIFVPFRVIAPVRFYIPFRSSSSQNFLFLAMTFFLASFCLHGHRFLKFYILCLVLWIPSL